jgi:hypothetical protein
VPFKPPDLGSAAMRAAPADPFDLWLSRGLHNLYSAVATEPVPQELLWLIDGLSDEAEARAIGPPSRERGIGMASKQQRFDQRVRERAYFLWLEEGRPRGRAAEHWRVASALQTAHEVKDDERAGALATASY